MSTGSSIPITALRRPSRPGPPSATPEASGPILRHSSPPQLRPACSTILDDGWLRGIGKARRGRSGTYVWGVLGQRVGVVTDRGRVGGVLANGVRAPTYNLRSPSSTAAHERLRSICSPATGRWPSVTSVGNTRWRVSFPTDQISTTCPHVRALYRGSARAMVPLNVDCCLLFLSVALTADGGVVQSSRSSRGEPGLRSAASTPPSVLCVSAWIRVKRRSGLESLSLLLPISAMELLCAPPSYPR